MLNKYSGSPASVVQDIFKDHGICYFCIFSVLTISLEWLSWNFDHIPKGFWDKDKSQQKFMEYLGSKLGYSKVEDWYNVAYKDVVSHGGG